MCISSCAVFLFLKKRRPSDMPAIYAFGGILVHMCDQVPSGFCFVRRSKLTFCAGFGISFHRRYISGRKSLNLPAPYSLCASVNVRNPEALKPDGVIGALKDEAEKYGKGYYIR